MEVGVGPANVTLHFDDHVLVSDPGAHIAPTRELGFFVQDTRLVSAYEIALDGEPPTLLASSEIEPWSARFELTNAERTLQVRLDRVVGRGVHEDYTVANHSRKPVSTELQVRVAGDFGDLFDVRAGRGGRGGDLESAWDGQALTLRYANRGFRRALQIRPTQPATYADGVLAFAVRLEPGEAWHTCVRWSPALDGVSFLEPDSPCGAVARGGPRHERARLAWAEGTASLALGDPTADRILRRSAADLGGLRLRLPGEPDDALSGWTPAAGVPWFVSLFGRDALVVSLQTLVLSPRFARASLRALAQLQADAYDDARDMQPGKIEHEVRHGELAQLGLIPHTPYYGTHEATTLFVWAAAAAWRWTANRGELDALRPHVERALAWIDRDGDLDGDGLQEYRTRAGKGGYYNQGWKDSGLAIVDEAGELASLPIALCEHQGFVVAAKRAWAGVLDEVYGETREATRLRGEADRLAGLLEERFWWEEEGTYYLGLDGDKRPLRSVSSNPGHLLWAGAVDPGRAARVAERLLADDLWSGWGIRTLSSRHPAYDPFSYQRGAVWPHDSMIAAAGLRRYGHDAAAARVIDGVFDAASRFRAGRLPELFAGTACDAAGLPVPYPDANVPQAWAAGAIVQAVDVLLGLEPDAPNGRLTLRPHLTERVPWIAAERLAVGDATVDLRVGRAPGGETTLETSGEIDVRLSDVCESTARR